MTIDNIPSLLTTLKTWEDLFAKSTFDFKERQTFIIVLEKIADIRPEIENFFNIIIRFFMDNNIIEKQDLLEWKKLNKVSYSTSLDNNIYIENELHLKLVSIVNIK